MEKRQEGGETVTHLSKVEARSGSRSTMTRTILLVSLTLVVLFLLIAVLTGFFHTDQTGADQVNADKAAPTSSEQAP